MIVAIQLPNGGVEERQSFTKVQEAEAHYIRLVQRRTPRPASVRMWMPADLIPAHYHLDADWPADTPREDEPERWRLLWTMDGPGPRAEHLRGAALAAGVSGLEVARRLGVSDTTWRKWIASDGASTRQQCPPQMWVALLSVLGLHPPRPW